MGKLSHQINIAETNIKAIREAEHCGAIGEVKINDKTVEDYFSILEDLQRKNKYGKRTFDFIQNEEKGFCWEHRRSDDIKYAEGILCDGSTTFSNQKSAAVYLRGLEEKGYYGKRKTDIKIRLASDRKDEKTAETA